MTDKERDEIHKAADKLCPNTLGLRHMTDEIGAPYLSVKYVSSLIEAAYEAGKRAARE